ncbi:MAG: hypothetical protein HGB34_00230 [Candidatus Moranbacteria bacterium]|nr:hypothetical protein [Candidatus Moranbacteria bacterium]
MRRPKTQEKRIRPDTSLFRPAETVLHVALKKLINKYGAKKIAGFRPWSIAIGSGGDDTARARFNAAYLLKMEKAWWILLPGGIENDAKRKYTRAALFVPFDGASDSEVTTEFFRSLFTGTDYYDKAVWCVSMSNGTFWTNDDAPNMGLFAKKLAEATPITGKDTVTGIGPEETIFGSKPTERTFSNSGRIQYRTTFSDKLVGVLEAMMSMRRH